MKTTFDLPDPLLRKAKALAAQQGATPSRPGRRGHRRKARSHGGCCQGRRRAAGGLGALEDPSRAAPGRKLVQSRRYRRRIVLPLSRRDPARALGVPRSVRLWVMFLVDTNVVSERIRPRPICLWFGDFSQPTLRRSSLPNHSL
jgi:hypothetical protein